MSNNYSHLLNTKIFGLFACLLFIVGSVLSESHLIKDVCHNHKWSGSQFIKDIHTCTCEPYNATDLQDKKSLIFFEVYGRLANRMLGYAMTLSVKREYGFRTFLRGYVLESLQYYFKGADQVAPMEQLCHEQYPWTEYLYAAEKLAVDTDFNRGKAIDYVNGARLMGNNINRALRWGHMMEKHLDEIRKTFTLKDKFLKDADLIINNITQAFLSNIPQKSKSKRAKKERVYVGIHLRKTDAVRDIVQKYRLPELKNSYFLSGMDAYAEKFPKKKFDLIFLLVSDDVEWVTHMFYPRVERHFHVFVAGTGNPFSRHAIGVDMAIMSRMNHTILSYGTFSFWGGFLSGGKRILPTTIFNRKPFGRHPLDDTLPVFTQPDEGLKYSTEKEEREEGYTAGKSI